MRPDSQQSLFPSQLTFRAQLSYLLCHSHTFQIRNVFPLFSRAKTDTTARVEIRNARNSNSFGLMLFKKYLMCRLRLGIGVIWDAVSFNSSRMFHKGNGSVVPTWISSQGLDQPSVHLQLRNCSRVGREGGEKSLFSSSNVWLRMRQAKGGSKILKAMVNKRSLVNSLQGRYNFLLLITAVFNDVKYLLAF